MAKPGTPTEPRALPSAEDHTLAAAAPPPPARPGAAATLAVSAAPLPGTDATLAVSAAPLPGTDATLAVSAAPAALPGTDATLAVSAAPPRPTQPSVSAGASAVIRPPRPAAVGEGRYVLGAEIARGGMGRVVEATDTLLHRTVAVKEALTTQEDALQRFARETELTARLEHPSIVPVYDAGASSDGAPFYAMRKVSGRPLGELIGATTALDQRLALLPHVLATAQAIAHAHTRGVIHRDLKPANILVGELGETIVIDWGLAKVIGDADATSSGGFSPDANAALETHAGSVFGTPGFMAPEQVRGEPVDARCDVYALGATLYYLLSRRPPHTGRTGAEMMVAALEGPPPRIGALVAGVPRALSTIIDKALAYDAAARHPDAGAFAEDLQRFLTGQLVASHHYTPRERLTRWLARYRLGVTVGAVALVALVGLGTLSVRRIVREKHRADVALRDALDRNELLQLGAAQALVATNPTAAVAQVKPLVTRHWQGARAVALAARSLGVARGLPASPRTLSIDVTHDGGSVLAAGTDGVVRLHDLAGETAREITRLPRPLALHLADQDRLAIGADATGILVVDIAAGTVRTLPAPVAVEEVAARGDELWLRGTDGSVWRQRLDAPAATRLALDDVIGTLAVAPVGGAVALGGARLWIVAPGALPRVVDRAQPSVGGGGPIRAIAWNAAGTRLAALSGDNAVVITDADGPGLVRHDVGATHSVTWDGADVVVGGDGTLTRITPTGAGPRTPIADGLIEHVLPGPRGALVAVTSAGTFTVVHPLQITPIPPTSRIDALATSARGRFVVAASSGVLLVWDVARQLPTLLPPSGVTAVAHLDGGQLVAAGPGDTRTWLDLTTGAQAAMAPGPAPARVIGAPGGEVALLLEGPAGAPALHRRGEPTARPLDAALADAMFLSTRRLAIATTTGEVQLVEVATGRRAALATGGPIAQLEARGGDDGWIVIRRADNALWRHHLATHTTTELPAQALARWQVLAPDGNVYIGQGSEVVVWRPDGTLSPHAALEVPALYYAQLLDDQRALFGTEDVGAAIVRLDRPGIVVDRFPGGSRMYDWSWRGDLWISRDVAGTISIADLTSTVTFPLARPAAAPFLAPVLGPAGAHAYALVDGRIAVWDVGVPTTPEATRQLLDALTNAHAVPGRGTLRWD